MLEFQQCFSNEIPPEKISFAAHLRGKEGLDSIENLSNAEIKLLEQMEDYVSKRSKLDADYAQKLGKLHDKDKFALNNMVNQYTNGSLVEKAWRMYITESENKAIIISNMAKQLNLQTLPQIKSLLMYKKEMCDKFKFLRTRMDREFDGSADEVNRLLNIYKNILNEASKVKEKLNKVDFKDAKDWHKIKERFDKVSRKLHMTHNDYCLSIATVNEHQKQYYKNLVPFLLNSVQDIQEEYVQPWKEILLSMQLNTSWCREEFSTSEKEINQSIVLIKSTEEYKGFINFHKQIPAATIPYFFDDNLVSEQDVTSGLLKDSLAVNDLTHKQLLYKKNSADENVESMKESLSIKKNNSQEEETALKDMQTEKNVASLNKIDQHFRCQYLKFEVEELSCKLSMHQTQLNILNEAICKVGDDGPKCYSTLIPPDSSVAKSGGGEGEKKRRTTFPKLLERFRTKAELSQETNSNLSCDDDRRGSQSACSSESEISYDQPCESLDESPWFHGKVDRGTVARLLKHDGDFIVREKSDSSGSYVLSVLWKGCTKHFILKANDKGLYTLEGESFPTIHALVTHHHERRSVIQSSTGIILMNSVNRVFMDGDEYVIPQDDVQLINRLGSGHFGDVYRGVLRSKEIMLAVKTCKESVNDVVKKQFLEEAEIMKPCVHKNVLKLIGICKDKEPFYILLELCEKGDLLGLLKKEGPVLTHSRLFDMSVDIARGMAYLEQRQIIHRDLAARNCLVSKDYTVKISDFGMSREEDEEGLYTIQTTKEIPFKWCAPEVWHHTKYSVKSDVWSYAVTLYEIYSLGQPPYPGWNNKHAREQIDAGYRMPSPASTPPEVYELMKKCWYFEDSKRPSFFEIVETLEKLKHHLNFK